MVHLPRAVVGGDKPLPEGAEILGLSIGGKQPVGVELKAEGRRDLTRQGRCSKISQDVKPQKAFLQVEFPRHIGKADNLAGPLLVPAP